MRVTYEPAGLAACFISPEAYGVPLGRTGRYAIGMHEPGADAWVAEAFPRLRRGRHDRVRVAVRALARRARRRLRRAAGRAGDRLGASNAMKFGPVIGERLAQLALTVEH